MLIKSHWFVGTFDSEVSYSYEPELILRLLPNIRSVYRDVLSMDIYAVLAQGNNEYDGGLLHISPTQNHISLNSLGLPFAQLMAIDDAARVAIRTGVHGPSELYMEEDFFHSLRFDGRFDKQARARHPYRPAMGTGPSVYFGENLETILSNLRPSKT